jgi:hypothetical protein
MKTTHKSPADSPPGTRAHEAAKGAPKKAPKVIDHRFVTSATGGPELQIPNGVEVRDNRTKVNR